jgi:hypothetical protein
VVQWLGISVAASVYSRSSEQQGLWSLTWVRSAGWRGKFIRDQAFVYGHTVYAVSKNRTKGKNECPKFGTPGFYRIHFRTLQGAGENNQAPKPGHDGGLDQLNSSAHLRNLYAAFVLPATVGRIKQIPIGDPARQRALEPCIPQTHN